jgi:hypothetical protein
MSLPAVAVRTAAPAVRSAVSGISAWISTAPIGKLNAFKDFIKRHPTLSSVVGSLGLDELVERALSGDDDSIQALNDAAAHLGLTSDGKASSESPGIIDRAQEYVGNLITGTNTESITNAEADKTQQMRDLALFIRSEVSGNPEFIIRYHALMNEFLSMDLESVKNLVRAY